jgi:Flp pilus assembly protein CpaB
MAHTATNAAVGRVNRRFLLLAFILAVLSAVLVYAGISRSGGESTSAGEVPVVVAKAAIPAGTKIDSSMVDIRQIEETDVGDQAFSTTDAVVNQVARYPIAANEQILLSKVVSGTTTLGSTALSNLLEEGKRGMGVRVEAVVNGGGLVLPGDRVDILWLPEKVDGDLSGAALIAENVEVVAVQQTLVDLPPTAPGAQPQDAEVTPVPANGSSRVRASEASANPEATTVVVHLTPTEAAQVFCADSSAGEIRFAVRAFGDDSPSGLTAGTCVVHPEGQ